ncbi:MAG: hypothetical protein M3Y55_07205 [Pseudomonadota bacterium]|nr:hypothetical protein [Pseudomonadota bacterium]
MPVLMVVALLVACQDEKAQLPSRANFTAAVSDYLAQRGHVCLAKYDWPIIVTPADRRANSLDAQQMTLLEAHGLVTGHDTSMTREAANGVAATSPAREYALTAAGQKYYLHVPVVVATASQRVTHPADFCVAKLSLDRVFGWESPQTINGHTVSSVLFSYQVDPAPWMRTPDARRVFPLAMRAIDNAGTLQLRLGVHQTPHGWVADELSA